MKSRFAWPQIVGMPLLAMALALPCAALAAQFTSQPESAKPAAGQSTRPGAAAPSQSGPQFGDPSASQMQTSPNMTQAPRSGARQLDPAHAKLTLEVGQGSQEFEQYRSSLIINAPQELAFRWSSRPEGLKKVKWVVGEGKYGSKILKSGTADSWKFFVDFKPPLIAGQPRAAPGIEYYAVKVIALDDQNNEVGKGSNWVVISYKQADAEGFVMGCTTKQDCPASQFCVNNVCADKVDYSCEAPKTLVGTDGTRTDCGNYRCAGDKCLKQCADVNDCSGDNICDAKKSCVPRSAPPSK